MVSLHKVIFVLIEVRDRKIVHNRYKIVKVNVFGLNEDINIDRSFESWFCVGQTENDLGASNGKSGKFVTHGNYIILIHY